jgi:6-phosphogluconolactonase (cycloisomerase 2 family)
MANSFLASDLEGSVLFGAKNNYFTYFLVNNRGELAPHPVEEIAEEPRAMALTSTGVFIYYATLDNIHTYVYDKAAKSLIGTSVYTPSFAATKVNIQTAACGLKKNRLYVGFQTTDTGLYYINTYLTNTQDGTISATTLQTCGSLAVPPEKLCIHPSGRYLYAGNTLTVAEKQIAAFKINQDGSLTLIATYNASTAGVYNIGELTMDPTGRYLFASTQISSNIGQICVSP